MFKTTNVCTSVYLHQREDKIWIVARVMLLKTPNLQLGIHNKTDIITFEININEKLTKLMNHPSGHCRNYNNAGFDNCCKNYIEAYLQKKANCTIPGNNTIYCIHQSKTWQSNPKSAHFVHSYQLNHLICHR